MLYLTEYKIATQRIQLQITQHRNRYSRMHDYRLGAAVRIRRKIICSRASITVQITSKVWKRKQRNWRQFCCMQDLSQLTAREACEKNADNMLVHQGHR